MWAMDSWTECMYLNQGSGSEHVLMPSQVDVIDAELLKPWERKRQEYKQRKKVRGSPNL